MNPPAPLRSHLGPQEGKGAHLGRWGSQRRTNSLTSRCLTSPQHWHAICRRGRSAALRRQPVLSLATPVYALPFLVVVTPHEFVREDPEGCPRARPDEIHPEAGKRPGDDCRTEGARRVHRRSGDGAAAHHRTALHHTQRTLKPTPHLLSGLRTTRTETGSFYFLICQAYAPPCLPPSLFS